MSVLPQCIDTCQTNRQGDVVAIVIGVICLLVVLSLILCIICAVCIKKKKRLEKHSFIMVNLKLYISTKLVSNQINVNSIQKDPGWSTFSGFLFFYHCQST